jgi:hypothetical protein
VGHFLRIGFLNDYTLNIQVINEYRSTRKLGKAQGRYTKTQVYTDILQKEFSETSSMILNRVAMSEIITGIPGKTMAKRPIQNLLSPQL